MSEQKLFKIYSRWDSTKVILERTGASLREVVIAAVADGADLSGAYLRGADLSGAYLRGADLRDAYLRDADLRGAYLRGADLSGAYLSGADLRDAYLRGADLRDADLSDVPAIENIHQKVYAAANQPDALDMSDWHTCDTTHCRAGWVVTLAGAEGKALEDRIGCAGAATLIYLKSDPNIERIPSWHSSNEVAMQDMKRLAELEAAR